MRTELGKGFVGGGNGMMKGSEAEGGLMVMVVITLALA